MSRPLPAGLREVRSRLPRDAVMAPAAVAAEGTVLRRAAAVTELLPLPGGVAAADAVEQLRLQPVQCCPRIAASRRR